MSAASAGRAGPPDRAGGTPKARRAFITGIAGFAGSHLAERLADAEGGGGGGGSGSGATRVGGLVRGLDAPRPNLAALEGRIDLFEGDVTDPAQVAAALRAFQPDDVYHLAGFAPPSAPVGQSEYAVNFLGTAALLEAVASTAHARPPRVRVVSSAAVQGAAESPNAESKRKAEAIALEAWRTRGIPTVVVRPFGHTGPRQRTGFIVPDFAEPIARAERHGCEAEVRHGNLDSVRELFDVRDAVRAYALVLERADPGTLLDICTGRAVSIGEVLDRLGALARVPVRRVRDEARVRPADVQVGDPSQLMALIGDEHPIGRWRAIDAILADVLAFWRDSRTTS